MTPEERGVYLFLLGFGFVRKFFQVARKDGSAQMAREKKG
jgi:hypothetical protein